MSSDRTFLTRDGLKKLEEELEFLRTTRRAQVAERLHNAQEDGELIENAEYEDAKNEQAFVEGRILTLETMLSNAVIIDEHGSSDVVALGARVTVKEVGNGTEEYMLVGAAEANPKEGRISNESPLGRALLGRRVGDEVKVQAPAGALSFRVIKITRD
jgi:transcription elongation factor GreA